MSCELRNSQKDRAYYASLLEIMLFQIHPYENTGTRVSGNWPRRPNGLDMGKTLTGKHLRTTGPVKLSDGMEIPVELSAFKFARQKSKLAGTIRGSYFVIKNDY